MNINELIEKAKTYTYERGPVFAVTDKTIVLRGCEYPGWVWEIERLFKPDYKYWENMKKRIFKLKDIEGMNEDELDTLVTSIYRAERFCDGVINVNLKDGTILRILERKFQLVEEPGNPD